VRLYSRNGYDLTAKLSAIAATAERIKAKSFTIDGEAVVVGPDGLSRFEDLRRREAAHGALLYAFDLIEHDGEDLRDHPFLDRKAALARLLRDTEAGILLNEHVAEDGPTVFAHACRLGAEGIVSKRVDGPSIRSVPGLDQGPQSREYRCAAGAQRELEQVITDFSRQERADVAGVDYTREVSASLHVAPALPSDSLLRSRAVPDAKAVEVLNVIALGSPQRLRKTNG